MAFIPYENINYETELKYQEIVKIINSIIEPKKVIRILSIFNENLKPYEGEIINRIIKYRNSFIPIIYGTINDDSNLTIINIKMKLHIFVKIFMFVFGYLLMTLAFKFESKKSKEYFKILFKAKIINKNANCT